jgi:hypothetical protein
MEQFPGQPDGTASYSTVSALSEVLKEYKRAKQLHPRDFNSLHEGYAVLLEEVDELWTECKVKKPDVKKIKKEAIQCAAMLLRFIVELT